MATQLVVNKDQHGSEMDDLKDVFIIAPMTALLCGYRANVWRGHRWSWQWLYNTVGANVLQFTTVSFARIDNTNSLLFRLEIYKVKLIISFKNLVESFNVIYTRDYYTYFVGWYDFVRLAQARKNKR